MKSLKILKWLTIAIIMPWLIFMILAVFKGGEIFARMGESIALGVQDMTLRFSKKADTIKTQADEWKEKLTGIKSEEKTAEDAKSQDEKAPAKKTKRTIRHSSVLPSPKPGDAQ
jgi:hypothetical protein